MKRKTIIAVLCAAAVVIAAAVVVTVFVLRDPPADIRDTPIPQRIETASALQTASMDESPIRLTDVELSDAEDSALLFGKRLPARVYKSDADDRKTEYLNDDGSVAYTSLKSGDDVAIYDAQGQAVYSSGTYKVDTDYLTEPVHWFYRGGALACGELCFYDGDNNGVAYFGADGALLCIRTEIVSVEDGKMKMINTWYDDQFEKITENAFRAAVPLTDADAFLYIEWA